MHPHDSQVSEYSLEHELLVELRPQQVVNKLALLALTVETRRLVLEDQVVVPSSLDGEGGRSGGGSRAGRGGCLTQSSLEVEQRVSCRYLLVPVHLAFCCCFRVLPVSNRPRATSPAR